MEPTCKEQPHFNRRVRQVLSTAILLSLTFHLSAAPGRVGERIVALQEQGARFMPAAPFTLLPHNAATQAHWSKAVSRADVLRTDAAATNALIQAAHDHLLLTLPGTGGSTVLLLQRVDIGPEDLRVAVASTGAAEELPPGLHYRGIIQGDPESIAAISLFEGQVMGLISSRHSDRVLGPMEGDGRDLHVFYDTEDLLASNDATCHTQDDDGTYLPEELQGDGTERTTNCVRYYWEVDYPIFQNKGSVVNTTNYVTGLFNQSAILFDNDGINVTLSQVFVWNVASPYSGPSTSNFLDQFGVHRTSFNGDMAHLLGASGGGGVAWLNTLCNSQARYRMAYSSIGMSYNNVPTYSWSVSVVSHEQGHNLGSRHTHACVWNGNNTAIDGCGPAAGYSEGNCPQGPLPTSSVGGTIMSYCHLTSSTIKFANGFGPQPTAFMVNRVNSVSCLTPCAAPCVAPEGLSASNIGPNSATITWNSTGAANYSLQHRPAGTSTWTTITGIVGTSRTLEGLSANTTHDYRVRSVCGTESSSYSGIVQFTTEALPCELAPTAVVAPRLFLEGPFVSAQQLMRDDLRIAGLIPLNEPYTALGYDLSGPQSTTPAVLAVTGNNAIVDWVVVELRSTSTPFSVVEARAALVQRDGDVVAVDGVSPVGFCVPPGNYRVAVRHRNHLGSMTSTNRNLGSTATTVNFTNTAMGTHGTEARKVIGNTAVLWTGNVVTDDVLKYTGTSNDRDAILGIVGGVSTGTFSGYHIGDVNLDGTVRYTGSGNDRDPILVNVGGGTPTNTRVEQVP